MSANTSRSEKALRIKCDGTNYTGAAGTTDLTSEAIDTQGFENVKIYIGFGAITAGAVTSVKVQQCDTSGGTYADLEGTSITVADDDDNQMTLHEIVRPRERFLKTVIDRGTQNAVVDFEVVVLTNARKQPSTDDSATVVSREVHASPAEGTA